VPLSLASPEVVPPEQDVPTVSPPSLGAAVLSPLVMPRLAPSFATAAPEPEPAAPVDQPGLRLPSPDRPSLGLALPARIDVPVPTLRPVWEEMPVPQVPSAKDVPGDTTAPERASPISVNEQPRAVAPELKPMPVGTPPAAPSMPGAPAAPGTPSIHFAPQITIHAPPGSDPQALADLLDSRLRSLIRDALRGSSAALHD